MALRGNGSNGAIVIAHNSYYDFDAGKIIAFWFRSDLSPVADMPIISKSQAGVGGYDFRTRTFNNKLRYYAWDSALNILGNFYSISTVNDGLWHFGVCRIVSKTMYGYLDGVYQGQNTNNSWTGSSNGGSVQIGNTWNGDLGGIMIFNNTLNANLHSRFFNGKRLPFPNSACQMYITMRESTGSSLNEYIRNVSGSIGANWSWCPEPDRVRGGG